MDIFALISASDLVSGLILFVIGGTSLKLYEFLIAQYNNFRLKKDINISKTSSERPKASSKFEKYLDVLFPDLTDTANNMKDETKREDIHEKLKLAAEELNTRTDKGWEYLSLNLVEKKMFGTVLDSMKASGEDEYLSSVQGGKDDFSIDSFIIQRNPEIDYHGIVLIQSKWHDLLKDSKNFVNDDHTVLDTLKNAGEYIFENSEMNAKFSPEERQFLEAPSNAWNEMKKQYVSQLRGGDDLVTNPKIYLVLVHHRRPKPSGTKSSFDVKAERYKVTCIDAINASEILSERISVQIKADTRPKEAVISQNEITTSLVDSSKDMRVFVGAITGFQLCRIYETTKVNHRRRDNEVLRMNVRRRLTSRPVIEAEEIETLGEDFRLLEKKKSIVAGMKKTIDDDELRYRFLSYNNGVTIVCSRFETKGIHTRKISNPQIVNGGQTTELLFSYYQNGSLDYKLKELKIPIKIVETKGKTDSTFLEIAKSVATMVNHQNPTNTRDLFANDEIFETLQSLFTELDHKIFLEIKEGEWELLLSQLVEGFSKKILDYIDTDEWQDNSTKRKVDLVDDVGVTRWAMLGGGSLANAFKNQIWAAKRSIYHTKEDEFPFLDLDNSLTIYDNEDTPFVLTDTKDNLLREVLLGQVLIEELNAIKSRMNHKKRGFKLLSDETEVTCRTNSLQAILVPHFCLLALNEVLRTRCDPTNLITNKTSEEARDSLLTFILGKPTERSDKSSRFNTLPFHTKQSRLFVKTSMGGWSSHKAYSDTSINILRNRFKTKGDGNKVENTIMDLIEFTVNNLAKVIYDRGILFPAKNWSKNKTELATVLSDFKVQIDSPSQKSKLLSIDLGIDLKTNQQKVFQEKLTTLKNLIQMQ